MSSVATSQIVFPKLGRWSSDERNLLKQAVKKHGLFNLRRLAAAVPTRSINQVRSYLDARISGKVVDSEFQSWSVSTNGAKKTPRPTRPSSNGASLVTPNTNHGQEVDQPERRALDVTNALSFLDSIKKQCAKEPAKYNAFLDSLTANKERRLGYSEMIERVANLFQDFPDLLEGFVTFLPDSYQEEAKEVFHRAANEGKDPLAEHSSSKTVENTTASNVDSSPDSTGQQKLPTPKDLVDRYVQEYGGTVDYSERVLEEYRKFMALKKNLDDFDASILSPPPAIDRMWHLHILDTRRYGSDCKEFCGEFIHHNPTGGLDQEARSKRTEKTKFAVQARYGQSYDEQIWSFETQRLSHKRSSPFGDGKDDRRPVKQTKSQTINLRFYEPLGDGTETYLKVGYDVKFGRIFAFFAKRKGGFVSSLRFLLAGEKLSSDETPRMLDLAENDRIDVLPEQEGC